MSQTLLSERQGLIYGICHIESCRWYIGQTVRTLECRWNEHLQELRFSKKHLYCALRKYGIQAFKVVVLEDSIPESQLDEKERYYIQKYRAYTEGFNNTTGGQGVRGYKHTEETRKKIGNSVAKGSYRWNTPERAAKIRAAQKGRQFTKEHLQRIKEAANRNKRCGLDNPFGGRTHTAESRKKMSVSSTRNMIQRVDKDTMCVLEIYENQWEAAEWVKSNIRTQAKLYSIYHRIAEAIYHLNGTQTAYGFIWNAVQKVENRIDDKEDNENAE